MAGRVRVAGHKQKGGKTFMVQREFGRLKVGRIYRSSGTADKNTFANINAMLTALAADGTPESVSVLRKLKAGELTFLDALAAYKQRGFGGVTKLAEPTASIDRDACVRWLRANYPKETTRLGYYANYRGVMRFARDGETMKDFPAIMQRYREWCVKNNKNFRAWDYSLAVCQAWVKATLGNECDTYLRLRRLKRFGRKPDPRKKAYHSPRDIKNLCQKLPEDLGSMVWSMAVYGMLPKEYMLDGWKVEGAGLHIFGEKTEHRDRLVPLLMTHFPAEAVVKEYRRLYDWLVKASKGRITPKSMRDAYPRWLSDAGISPNRVRMYQGHEEQEQTDTYAFHDITRHLQSDAEKFEAWLNKSLAEEPASTDTEIVTLGERRGWSKKYRGGYYEDIAALK